MNDIIDFSEFATETGVNSKSGKNSSLYRPEFFTDSNGIKLDKSQMRKLRGQFRDKLNELMRIFAALQKAKSKNVDSFLSTFLKYYKATYSVTDFSVKSVTNSTETAQNFILMDLLTAAKKANEKLKII